MINEKILSRYLSGKGSESDRKEVIRCFTSLPEEEKLRRLCFSQWEHPEEGPGLTHEKAQHQLDRIHHLIRLRDKDSISYPTTGKKIISILTRIAAILFIPLLISLWMVKDQVLPADRGNAYSEIVCPPGTRTMFVLPDGSSGWLNSGSTLSFPDEFRGKTRHVNLTGEGFFQVESSQRKPFIVTSSGIQVIATGTTFNVNSYPDELVTEVTLVEGKVDIALEQNGRRRFIGSLYPGQIARSTKGSARLYIQNADIEKHTAWKDGKLIFRDDLFKKVAEDLSRWYNVDFVITDKALNNYTYVGTFEDETLEEVLKLLALTAPISYRDLGRIRREDGSFEKRRIEVSIR
jgi:ferric-dicitrate binding protein FerR (iron transport regulator)